VLSGDLRCAYRISPRPGDEGAAEPTELAQASA
jgi:hypothetical protein